MKVSRKKKEREREGEKDMGCFDWECIVVEWQQRFIDRVLSKRMT